MSIRDRKKLARFQEKLDRIEGRIFGTPDNYSARHKNRDIEKRGAFLRRIHTLEKRILHDDILKYDYYGSFDYAFKDDAYRAKDVKVVDELRQSTNFQTKMANRERLKRDRANVKYALSQVPDMSLAAINQFMLEELHHQSEVHDMENPMLSTLVPFTERNVRGRYEAEQASMQRGFDLRRDDIIRRSEEGSAERFRARQAAEVLTLHQQNAAAKHEAEIRARVNPPTVRQIMNAQFAAAAQMAGGMGNFGAYNPLNDQQLLTAGFMTSLDHAENIDWAASFIPGGREPLTEEQEMYEANLLRTPDSEVEYTSAVYRPTNWYDYLDENGQYIGNEEEDI